MSLAVGSLDRGWTHRAARRLLEFSQVSLFSRQLVGQQESVQVLIEPHLSPSLVVAPETLDGHHGS